MTTLEKIETIEILDCNTNKVENEKQPTQCLHWCFTWNNYCKEDIETLETLLHHLCHKYAFQEEVGKKGTPHLQGILSLKKRARWTEFGLNKEIHWEKCVNVTASYLYCTKLDTRAGNIYTFNYDLPYTQNITNLYRWQKHLIDIIKNGPDERSIHWIHEPNGCAGKTTFQKYIFTHFDKCIVLSGKGADMKNGIVDYKKKTGSLPEIIIINIPRSVDSQYLSYTGIEEIKDMFFYSGKYEGGMVCGKNPLVLCFSNKEPDYEEMSKDRWKVIDIASFTDGTFVPSSLQVVSKNGISPFFSPPFNNRE